MRNRLTREFHDMTISKKSKEIALQRARAETTEIECTELREGIREILNKANKALGEYNNMNMAIFVEITTICDNLLHTTHKEIDPEKRECKTCRWYVLRKGELGGDFCNHPSEDNCSMSGFNRFPKWEPARNDEAERIPFPILIEN